jgi:lipoprotein-anchoring transpeptidase ErfK/SrfK
VVFKTSSLLHSLIVVGALALSSVSAMALKVDVAVNKASQKMTVKVDGDVKYVWLVSTGAAQYETPSGAYHIFRMEKEHFSKEWDDAPMPYSMFFTGQGHAIHGSYHINRLGTKASHGCVRLAPQNAAILFDLVSKAGYKNSTVSIKGGFFDTGPALTADAKPHKPFVWFWNKPKVKVKVAVNIVAPKKKKKLKTAVIIGGKEG